MNKMNREDSCDPSAHENRFFAKSRHSFNIKMLLGKNFVLYSHALFRATVSPLFIDTALWASVKWYTFWHSSEFCTLNSLLT